MPGTPRSRGCATCQKRKKKCDEVKPTCGPCTRLRIKCVGNGAKRWKFISFNTTDGDDSPAPAKSLSNQTTGTAAALVHILGITDLRYDIRVFGGKAITDIPAQMGNDPTLDIAVAAAVAVYNSRQFGYSTKEALVTYGNALAATRTMLDKPVRSPMFAMQTLLMIFICQALLDRKHADRIRVMMVSVFRDAAIKGTTSEVDPHYVYGICQICIWASLADPTFTLGPWFWDIYEACRKSEAIKYRQGPTFHSLDVSTLAQAATFLRRPAQHLYQLRSTYDLIQHEKPRIRQLVAMANSATLSPTGAVPATRLLVNYLFSWGLMLAFEALINKNLRNFNGELELWEEARECYYDALELAQLLDGFRPRGSAFIPDMLKAIWAATSDAVDDSEMEEILKDYERDVQGADYLGEANDLKRGLNLPVGKRTAVLSANLQQTASESEYEDDLGAQCVIL